jgi:hypothetical protein
LLLIFHGITALGSFFYFCFSKNRKNVLSKKIFPKNLWRTNHGGIFSDRREEKKKNWRSLEPLQEKMDVEVIVVAPIVYSDLSEDNVRYELGRELCRQAVIHQIHVILVDGSSAIDHDTIRNEFERLGTLSSTTFQKVQYVHVYPQTRPGKKGTALREALGHAYQRVVPTTNTIIAFQEPEKVDMMRHWKDLARYMIRNSLDICVPQRIESAFRATYPIEQYHTESFGNAYINLYGTAMGLPSHLDWFMGPIALRPSLVPIWQDYDGDLWDAQMVPMIRAFFRSTTTTTTTTSTTTADANRTQPMTQTQIGSFPVDFRHPLAMKQQEEGSALWCEKRLFQMNYLFPILIRELTMGNNPNGSDKKDNDEARL